MYLRSVEKKKRKEEKWYIKEEVPNIFLYIYHLLFNIEQTHAARFPTQVKSAHGQTKKWICSFTYILHHES